MTFPPQQQPPQPPMPPQWPGQPQPQGGGKNTKLAVIITAICVVVVAALAFTIWLVASSTGSKDDAAPAPTVTQSQDAEPAPTADGGASAGDGEADDIEADDPGTPAGTSGMQYVEFGTGERVVDTYVDFLCPVCGQFEQLYGDQLWSLVDDGTITLRVHPVAILDRFSQGTEYSTRSAASFLCAAEDGTDAARAYMAALFENQPAENTAGLSDAELSSLAEDAGVDVQQLTVCMAAGLTRPDVEAGTAALPAGPDGGAGTPTVVIDGTYTQLGDISANPNYFTDLLGE